LEPRKNCTTPEANPLSHAPQRAIRSDVME
ncbi:Hypothetical predicted protein, partial [Cloeon dipterum]